MIRFDRLCACAVGVLWIFVVAPVTAQSCIGDCNSSGSVAVEEVVIGLNIALGVNDPSACGAFGGGTVTVDDLVVGVRNLLEGCPSSNVTERFTMASSSVTLSSLYVMDFGSLGLSGGGGQSLALTQGPGPSPAVGGGAGFGCETLFCPFGGTEVRCCEFESLTFQWSQCVLEDGTEVDGFYRVESFDEDPCFFVLPQQPAAALPPPLGIHFIATLENYSQASGDFFGNFFVIAADLVEEFEPFEATCRFIGPSDRLFEPLGFAIRGDGTRFLEGSVRTIIGSGPQILQDVGTTFGDGSGDVAVDVIIDDGEFSCFVDTEIDGTLFSTNGLTGREFTETYHEFIVTEEADSDGSYLIELDGVSTTDCLGEVDILTIEPLKIFPDAVCPVGGELGLEILEQGSFSTVSYTDFGGVEFDFDSDGEIDDERFSCVDLAVDECSVQQAQGICTACSGPSDCGSPLICAPCLFCDESAAASRCAPRDDFVACDDGIFGELIIELEPAFQR